MLTSLVRLLQAKLQPGMTATSGFSVWFLTLTKLKKFVVSCADSMAYVGHSSHVEGRKDFLELAHHLQVNRNKSTLFYDFTCWSVLSTPGILLRLVGFHVEANILAASQYLLGGTEDSC